MCLLYIVHVLCVVYTLCHVWLVSYYYHRTHLHISSQNLHTLVVSMLLSQEGVDVNIRDKCTVSDYRNSGNFRW